ncbi:alpha-hydroxy-acid oxidizing protein [Pseudomonas sp. dw_358]|uniref:alpha-hydroxy-acid oxidizing protein n=1 Tax=Pseudomonas sp. dw_358 TaxID=2720083 RepID=UPI001BD41B6E|nr:alpha-hydroxy-acid oxidizing protein [Pseudomonas sp. dw_358]
MTGSTTANAWPTGERVAPLKLTNLLDLEALAQAIIPATGFDYIVGGAGAEQTLQENRASFDRRFVTQRVLTGKVVESLQTRVLGSALASPVIIAPMGGQAIAHVSAEAGTARGAHAAGTLLTVSTVSTLSLEDIAQASNGDKWFQLYLTRDDGFNRELIQRAVSAGYKAIALTVDVPVGGHRERCIRHEFAYPPVAQPRNFLDLLGQPRGVERTFQPCLDHRSLDFVRQHSPLPLIIKGIASPLDALAAVDFGADALQVSNHGGRQLDGTPGAFSVLPSIAQAVQGRVPLIFDSGIRRGLDVFKALASGADVVALGRPVLFGLALGGWQGVESVLNHINAELRTVMQLAGAATVADIRGLPLVKVE